MSPAEEQLQASSVKSKGGPDNTTKKATGRCFKGSDVFHRMNFLTQVQQVVSTASPESNNLHAFYGYTLQLLSRRTQSKLDRSLKRILCKKCSTPLRPGTNFVRVRTRGKKSCKRLVLSCRICETVKRFPMIEATNSKGTSKADKNGQKKKKNEQVASTTAGADQGARTNSLSTSAAQSPQNEQAPSR